MDFSLSDEQRLLRDEVGRYVEDNIIDQNNDWDDLDNFPEEVYQDLAEMGIFGMLLPEEEGGEDLDDLTSGVIYEQLGRGDIGLAMLTMVQNTVNGILHTYGTERHQDIATSAARGEHFVCFGLTEPEHGSDARAIETEAVRDGDEWVLNGAKTAITGSTFADYCVLFARQADIDEIRAFCLPMDADGLDVQRYVGMGCDHAGWGQLFLDDVRLPASERLGDHDAFKVIMRNFDSNRGWIPLFCLGGARQSLDETEEYLTERETFGQPVASYQGPQFEIAELETKYEAARLKAYESLWLADEGETNTKAAAQAKWYGVDTAREIIHDCMVLHGNYGYSEGFNFSKRLRDVMGLEIGEGPPQIQKLVIAREVFGREYLPTK